MRKAFFGVVWFFALWLGTLFMGGAVVGSLATRGSPDMDAAMEASNRAGEQFGINYGGVILLGSLAVAILGAWYGFLPGTRSKAEQDSPAPGPTQPGAQNPRQPF